jgi:hypothetical protein
MNKLPSLTRKERWLIAAYATTLATGMLLLDALIPHKTCDPLPPTYEKDLGALRCWYQNPPDKCAVALREAAPLYCERKQS